MKLNFKDKYKRRKLINFKSYEVSLYKDYLSENTKERLCKLIVFKNFTT